MNIFDLLKDIIEVKSGEALDNFDTLQEFQPYIVCRWLSMYSSDHAEMINCTVNEVYPGIETKEMWYQLLTTIVPQNKYRYANYIKKSKKEKKFTDKEVSIINLLSRNLEMSRREVAQMLEQHPIDSKMFKDTI